MNPFLTSEEIKAQHQALQSRVLEIGNRTYKERIKLLTQLEKVILKRRDDIKTALHEDFRKPPFETDLSEIYVTISELRHAKKHLREWTSEQRVGNPIALLGMRSFVRSESKGLVLIIAPWNYPIALTLGPLISAIAAGNAIILKPSEIAPKSSSIIAEIVNEAFPNKEAIAVCGDASTAQDLLSLQWNHIFFTGSPEIGKIVLQSSVEHLTPVTLELGGKSPAIVDETANIDHSADRIIWGKCLNAGQTCIAPDYVLVHESKKNELLRKMEERLKRFYQQEALPADHASIVSEKHYQRQCELLDDAVSKGGKVLVGGNKNDQQRFLSTTIVCNTNKEMRLMKEEIFGPLLPILSYSTWEECMKIVNEFERPLSLYHFSTSRKNIRKAILDTRAGSTCINQTLVHFNHPDLPFGGINWSGMGKAHGRWGFELFSNQRSFVQQRYRLNALRLVGPPYKGWKQKLANLLIRYT